MCGDVVKNSIEGGEIMVIDCWCVCVFVWLCLWGCVCVCVCRRGCVCVLFCFLSVMMSSGMESVVGWFVVVWEDLRWFGGCEVEVKYVLHRVGG